MSPRPDHNHHIRQVVLPSGRTIQVVYFEGAETAAHQSAAHQAGDPSAPVARVRDKVDLHVCDHCASELVYPVEWEESGADHWEVSLRCPDCEWTGTGIYSQQVVERFDAALDRGSEALVRDLQQLARANMEEDVERFLVALSDDHVLPSDF